MLNSLKSYLSRFAPQQRAERFSNPDGSFITVTNDGVTFSDMSNSIYVTANSSITIPAVLRAVNLLGGTVASMPFEVVERDSEGNKRILVDHNLSQTINTRPNDIMSAFAWREKVMTDLLLLDGNHFSLIYDDGDGGVELRPIADPSSVEVYVDPRYYTKWFRVPGFKEPLTSDDVLHIAGFGFDGIRGQRPLQYAKKALKMGLTVDQFTESYFDNSANLSGMVTTPPELSPEMVKPYEARIRKLIAGAKKAGKIFFSPAGADFKAFKINAEDAQLLETRQFSIYEIARIFGVPPHKLYELARSTNNNIEHQGLEWVSDTVGLWAKRISSQIDHSLLKMSERGRLFTRFDLKELKRGDMKSVAEYFSKLVPAGVYKPDEARAWLGENKTGGDASKLRYPVNTSTMDVSEFSKNSKNDKKE